MSKRGLQALMNKCAKLAEKHNAAMFALGEAVRERYGVHYSDVDCDGAIESFDLNGGGMTVEQLDEQMAMCGAPKL